MYNLNENKILKSLIGLFPFSMKPDRHYFHVTGSICTCHSGVIFHTEFKLKVLLKKLKKIKHLKPLAHIPVCNPLLPQKHKVLCTIKIDVN